MNTRAWLLAASLSALLAGAAPSPAPADPTPTAPAAAPTPTAAPATADTPAVAAVRRFLEARAAGRYAEAYALLSDASRQSIAEKDFLAGDPPPADIETGMTAQTFGVLDLFSDTHNAAGYTFTVLGPDPADPAGVLVRAQPPTSGAAASPPAGGADTPMAPGGQGKAGRARGAATLRLVTVGDPADHAARLDAFASMERSDPEGMAKAQEAAQRTESVSNLKQLSLGVLMYAQDHGGRMPDAANWADQIMPYVKNLSLFTNPSATAGGGLGYAYNRALSGVNMNQVASPSQTVLLFESGAGVKNAADTGQSALHAGGDTGYAFADGHVKRVPDGTPVSYLLTGK